MSANRDYVFPARIRAQCIRHSDGFRKLYYSNTVQSYVFNKCLIIIIFILVWKAWVYKIIGSRCLDLKTHVKYIIMTISHKLITVFCNKFPIQWGGNVRKVFYKNITMNNRPNLLLCFTRRSHDDDDTPIRMPHGKELHKLHVFIRV